MLPGHVGIIPDGNRRWANKRGISLNEAYRRGLDKLIQVIDHLFDRNIKYVTVYAMSMDNCKRRGKLELAILRRISRIAFRKVMSNQRIRSGEARVTVLGEPGLVGGEIEEMAREVMEKSRWGQDYNLTILYCYSGRWEIERARLGYTPASLIMLPPLDLVIRTGGYPRLSGFLPLLADYTELYSTTTLWPDITLEEVDRALEWYAGLPKNYGR